MASKGLEDVAGQAVKSLEAIGRAAVNKSLGSVAGQAADTVAAVGKASTEKGLDVSEQAARSLAFLSLSSEDLVNLTGLDESNSAMIQEGEFYLAEQERTSFQRFKDLYEENLKRFLANQKGSNEEA